MSFDAVPLNLDHPRRYGLKMNFVQSQGYHGTLVMNETLNGASIYISQKHLLAVYVHCSVHSQSNVF
jgi:hypothetical protein